MISGWWWPASIKLVIEWQSRIHGNGAVSGPRKCKNTAVSGSSNPGNGPKYFWNPEIVEMVKFLDPVTTKLLLFLDPKIVKMDKQMSGSRNHRNGRQILYGFDWRRCWDFPALLLILKALEI